MSFNNILWKQYRDSSYASWDQITETWGITLFSVHEDNEWHIRCNWQRVALSSTVGIWEGHVRVVLPRWMKLS